MLDFFELIVARDEKDARREAQANNAARLAFSQHKLNSTGLGAIRGTRPVIFSVAFLEEPLFTQGTSVIRRPSEGSDPVGSAGVYQWERNPKGHYIGAYVYLRVSADEMLFEASGDAVSMTHHLLFQGVGYKDLGQQVATEAQLASPRTVGFGV